MKLSGRNLSVNMTGDDVQLLHDELALLGSSIPEGIRLARHFDDGATLESVRRFQADHGLEPSGIVDDTMAAALDSEIERRYPYSVRGTVRYSTGEPAADLRIGAFDCDLRRMQRLGEDREPPRDQRSNSVGAYCIHYSVRQFRRAEQGSADLRIVVRDESGEELARSPILFNAGMSASIDIEVPGTSELPELVRYLAEIEPLLEGLAIRDLTGDDLDFISGDTGIPRERIGWIRLAEQLAQSTSVTDTAIGIPLQAFYAWFRQGLPNELAPLLAISIEELLQSLRAAIQLRLVPAELAGQLEGIAGAIRELRSRNLLEQPLANGGGASLRNLLGTLPKPLGDDQKMLVASVIGELPVEDAGFLPRLVAQGLSERRARDVQRTLRLGTLTGNHASLTAALQRRMATPDDNLHDGTLRPLASVRPDEWLDLAYQHAATLSGIETEERYADKLSASIEERHPTDTLTLQLKEGGIDLPDVRDDVIGFLRDNPTFDIASTRIPEQATFDKIPNGTKLRAALEQLQRFKSLSATWVEVGELLRVGVDSPVDIVGLGPDRLKSIVEGRIDDERIDAIYHQAKAAHDLCLGLLSVVSPRFRSRNAIGITEGSTDARTTLAASEPTIASLFGPLDRCACGHCRSVLGPTAYFADLMRFVQRAPRASEALFRRRPDLLDQELSCENSETEVSFIDLVNEVLENAVALPLRIDLPPGTDPDRALETSPMPTVIANAIGNTAHDVASNLLASRPDIAEPTWVVADRHRRWTLNNLKESLRLSSRYRIHLDVTPQGANLVTWIEALNQGGDVPADLRTRLDPLLMRATGGPAEFAVTAVRSTPILAGRRWTLKFQRGVRVTLPDFSDGSRDLTLQPIAGGEPRRNPYSIEALRATQYALSVGEAGGLLGALLPRQRALRVRPDADTRWILEADWQEIELIYTPPGLEITSLAYQSTRTDVDVLAQPQNLNPAAYAELARAWFPWTLPADLSLYETRALLSRAQTSRLELLERVNPAGRLTDPAIACETLGISIAQLAALASVATPTSTPSLWQRWGLDVVDGAATLLDRSTGTNVTDAPLRLLSKVSLLFQQSRLTIDELRLALNTQFVAAGAAGTLVITPATECVPSAMTLNGLTEATLDRLHRFVRLQRLLGWAPADLDRALAAIRAAPADLASAIPALANIQRVRIRLSLPLESLLVVWGGFSPYRYLAHGNGGAAEVSTLYERLFRSESGAAASDRDFELNGPRTDLVDDVPSAGRTIAGKLQFIASALRTDPASITALLTAEAVQAPLRLPNLGRLYAIIRLMGTLGLAVQDWLDAVRLFGEDPLVVPSATIRFVEFVDAIVKSGFTFEELAYLLVGDTRPGTDLEPSDDTIVQIRVALKRLARDQAERVAVPYSDADTLPAADADDAEARRRRAQLGLKHRIATSAVEVLARHLGGSVPFLRWLLIESEPNSYRGRLRNPDASAEGAIQVFLDESYLTSDTAASDSVRKVIGLLSRAILLCQRLRLTPDDLAFWPNSPNAQTATGLALLDFNELPAAASATGVAARLAGWRRLVTFASMRNRDVNASAALRSYLVELDAELNRPQNALRVWDSAFALPSGSAMSAANRLRLPFDPPSDLRDPLRLHDLLELLLLQKRLGATDADLAVFVDYPMHVNAPATARQLLRSKCGAESWAAVIRPISDELRVRRRDLLVDYLLSHAPRLAIKRGEQAPQSLGTAADLYKHFLIDVEMGPCMRTTRLLQATAAVQLFVQRCLLNLEPDVRPDAIDRSQWEWMSKYRVWEANRKIFLYPENWLLPELRDDRTEPFRQMESEFSGGEVRHSLAKTAFLTYLDELGEVSQVVVLGMHEAILPSNVGAGTGAATDSTANARRTLYVVGRSNDAPYRFYWRQCVNFGAPEMQWGGWERLEIDATTDHVMPFLFEGDLHVAWPIIKKLDHDSNTERGHWEVQLAWVRRTGRGWSKKKLCREVLQAPRLVNKDENQSLTFRIVVGAEEPLAYLPNRELVSVHLYRVGGATQPRRPIRSNLIGRDRTSAQRSSICIAPKVVRARRTSMDLVAGAAVWLDVTGAAGSDVPLLPTVETTPSSGPIDRIDPTDDSPGPSEPLPKYSNIADLVSKAIASKLKSKERNPVLLGVTDERGAVPSIQLVFGWPSGPQVRIEPGSMKIDIPGRELREFFDAEDKALRFTIWATPSGSMDPNDPSRSSKLSQTYEYEIPQVSWEPSLVFEVEELDDEPPRTDSKVWVGSWAFRTGGDMQVRSGSIAHPSLDDEWPTGATPHGNRLLRGVITDAADLSIVLGNYPFGTDYPQTFALVPATRTLTVAETTIATGALPTPSLWHFRDSVSSYYLLPKSRESIAEGERMCDSMQLVDRQRALASARWQLPFLEEPSTFNSLLVPASPSPTQPGAPHEDTARMRLMFDSRSPSAVYWWELFLHAPLSIADALSKHQRFEEAREWFHTVFDPTIPAGNDVRRAWRFLPFRQDQDNRAVDELLGALARGEALSPDQDPDGVIAQIARWRRDPFNPFTIARMRPRAFRWRVVVAYVENLLAWGDQLFRRFTRESIQEATQIYVLAESILGPRPIQTPPPSPPPPQTYRQLSAKIDDFSNAWTSLADHPAVKALLALLAWLRERGIVGGDSPSDQTEPLTSIGSLYFCIPPNDRLEHLWSRVEDRLLKIRTCRDIDGTSRTLALWEPPIDPELLIRARAAGIDLSDAIADLYAPMPQHRFVLLLSKATELANEVKQFGSALLAALEKKDGEALSLLRSKHELEMTRMLTHIKRSQIEEAQRNIDVLRQSEVTARERLSQYQRYMAQSNLSNGPDGVPLVEQGSRLAVAQNTPNDFSGLGLTQPEVDQLGWLEWANGYSLTASATNAFASVAYVIPNFTAGTPLFSVTHGGQFIGHAASAVASVLSALSNNASYQANRSSMVASYQRRREEWVHQSTLAVAEIRQIRKQIIAAEVRLALVERELRNHERQIEQIEEVGQFLRDKATNERLYGWMAEQLSFWYRQSYDLALDWARRAERAFRIEIGREDTSFIRSSAWDSRREGLLVGEALAYDLRRMEVAYHEENRRELELTKNISLARIAPRQLMELRAVGSCRFKLEEELFDLDFPRHFFRRIKSVSLSIPCVVGPFTSVNATLHLTNHSIRAKAELKIETEANPDGYARVGSSDDRFLDNRRIPYVAIATSSAQNDSGVFELNFRDERYLPFEGAGAVNSEWFLELSGKYATEQGVTDLSQFDFSTITDVVLQLRYRAREAEQLAFRNAVVAHLERHFASIATDTFSGQPRLLEAFDLQRDFADDWGRMLAASRERVLAVRLLREQFPYLGGLRELRIRAISLLIQPRVATGTAPAISAKINDLDLASIVARRPFGNEGLFEYSCEPQTSNAPMNIPLSSEIAPDLRFTLGTPTSGLAFDGISDAWLLVSYSLPGNLTA